MELLNKIFGITSLGISKKVRQGFAQRFPGARNVEWTVQKEFAEAIFYDQEIEKIVRFNNDGKLFETRINISPLNVPENISEKIHQEYEIMNCIAVYSNGSVSYELIVRDGQLVRYVALANAEGQISTPEPL